MSTHICAQCDKSFDSDSELRDFCSDDCSHRYWSSNPTAYRVITACPSCNGPVSRILSQPEIRVYQALILCPDCESRSKIETRL